MNEFNLDCGAWRNSNIIWYNIEGMEVTVARGNVCERTEM